MFIFKCKLYKQQLYKHEDKYLHLILNVCDAYKDILKTTTAIKTGYNNKINCTKSQLLKYTNQLQT